jgi:FAD/FMN-containing dehydrogenase
MNSRDTVAQQLTSINQSETVNDKHSEMNTTRVTKVSKPHSVSDISTAIKKAQSSQSRISIAGGRHAMGGQQFLRDSHLLDMTAMNRIIHFDKVHGLLELQAGIFWPAIIEYLQHSQSNDQWPWAISQKQTGCDNLSIGGALSANIHGRGLSKAPFISDIESFEIVMHDGQLLCCDRANNSQLFALAIGGYGLFGVIVTVTLRLVRQSVLQRRVEIIESHDVIERMLVHIKNGATYGDFQFSIDHTSDTFLKQGILSTYHPCYSAKVAGEHRALSEKDWRELLFLAHSDKAKAFDKYVKHYLATDKQLYSSSTMQLSTYIDGYHQELNSSLPTCSNGSEMITELYVPRAKLGAFLAASAERLRRHSADLIYGTVRLIEQDHESFLAWATQPWACTIFNLHVEHTISGFSRSRETFRELIQLASSFGGTYYLTYHRFATRDQLLSCHPDLPEFFRLKAKYDPQNVFGSDWYDHTLDLIENA